MTTAKATKSNQHDIANGTDDVVEFTFGRVAGGLDCLPATQSPQRKANDTLNSVAASTSSTVSRVAKFDDKEN